MAAVIRAARIDPERVLLAIRGGPAPAHAASPAHAARGASAETPAPVAAAPIPVPDWTTPPPLEHPPLGIGVEPTFDREAEERVFRDALEAERAAALADAQEHGFAAGRREAQAEFDQSIAAVGALLESLHEVLAQQIAGAEDVIVEIAFEAVSKILGDSVAGRDGAVAIVRQVLHAVSERERLLVRVAPADYELLLAHRAHLLPRDEGRTLELVADDRVALGGCLVETTGGTLDGRLETQLQRLADTLASARRMQPEALG